MLTTTKAISRMLGGQRKGFVLAAVALMAIGAGGLLGGGPQPRAAWASRSGWWGEVVICSYYDECTTFHHDNASILDNINSGDAYSVDVYYGTVAALYDVINFGGGCSTVTGVLSSGSGYTNYHFQYKDSLKVGVECNKGKNFVALCQHRDYDGPCASFIIDNPDLNNSRVGTDETSSLLVPAGKVVTVFQGTWYSGACEVFRASDKDLRDNYIYVNTISSLKLTAVPGCRGY